MLELIATVALGCSVGVHTPDLCFGEEVQVYAGHFEPEMSKILYAVRATAPTLEKGAVWITSANDGGHVIGSLHFQNRAFDIRTSNIVGHRAVETRHWASRMQLELGRDYDVIIALDHIHVEWDPKGD